LEIFYFLCNQIVRTFFEGFEELTNPSRIGKTASLHELKFGETIPNQLDRNGEDEEAEDTVDGTGGGWTEAGDEGTTQPKEQVDDDSETGDSKHHSEVAESTAGGGG